METAQDLAMATLNNFASREVIDLATKAVADGFARWKFDPEFDEVYGLVFDEVRVLIVVYGSDDFEVTAYGEYLLGQNVAS